MVSMRTLPIIILLLSTSIVTIRGQSSVPDDTLARKLTSGQVIFGLFSGDKTAEQGARMAGYSILDFVFPIY